jgi:hypothetical protein
MKTPQLLKELIRLRYLLLWRICMHSWPQRLAFAVYHLILLLSGVMALNAGATMSILGLTIDAGHRILQMAIWTIFLGATCSSILLGIGVEGAFSATGLRRYPLSAATRHLFSHVLALITPVWISCGAFSLSCAVAFSIHQPSMLLIRLVAAFCFLMSTYAFCCVLASFIKSALESHMWLAVLAASLILTFFMARYVNQMPVWIITAAHWSPPGLFAHLLLQTLSSQAFVQAGALMVWLFFLGFVLIMRSEDRRSGPRFTPPQRMKLKAVASIHEVTSWPH